MRKLILTLTQVMISVQLISCGSHDSGSLQNVDPYAGKFAANVMPVVVGNCGANGYANEPCTEIKICVPGTSDCQTIKNILVDTGSYGLRIFSSEVKIGLKTQTNEAGLSIAECAQFGTSNAWGPVQLADVILASEAAVTVPIQIIDSNFQKVPVSCISPDVSAAESGYSGILGVGLLVHDCGVDCVTGTNSEIYFSCDSNSCTTTAVPLDKQVMNPVSQLSTDNNGVILELPSVADAGVSTITGTLTLGIGTAKNNDPTGVKVFAADASGDFKTQFLNHSYQSSFIDSGSNGLFFPPTPELPLCDSGNIHAVAQAGFFCPQSTQSFSATQISADGTTSVHVPFSIANAQFLLNSFGPVAGAFPNLGGSQTASFDWGLPFFYGKKIYVGLEGKSSKLASGPYWAW